MSFFTRPKSVAKILALLLLWGCSSAGPHPERLPASAPPDAEFLRRIESTLSEAQKFVVSIREKDKDGAYWNRPLFMGPSYVAQYFLMLKWLGKTDPRLDVSRLRRILRDSQLQDGSWQQVRDSSLRTGNLDATVVNYWALKVMGEDVESERMARARNFILAKGGTEKTTLFVKTLLALFGLHSWGKTYWIPGTFVSTDLTMNQFAQWIRPHLIPIAYLRYRRVRKYMGPKYDLKEIGAKRVGVSDDLALKGFQEVTHEFQKLIVHKMLETQQPLGSWGGYITANLFTLAAFDDFDHWNKGFKQSHAKLISRAHEFVSRMLLDNGLSDYRGTVCDGRFWDTMLIHRGMVDSGYKASDLFASTDYLASKQVKKGGIPFGLEFEYAPDVDDTAEFVTAMATTDLERYNGRIHKALEWILSMQNHDGGWGAFDRNNTGNPALELVTAQFKDSADLFDDSSEDVTGHVLEAYGKSHAIEDSELSKRVGESIARARQYLEKKQHKKGPWWGRWGVNYVYGTGAVVTGLQAISPEGRPDPLVYKALSWLEKTQNSDGGFGETTASYMDEDLIGKGASTPSQTAWALLALVEGGEGDSVSAHRAVEYLLKSFDSKRGKWTDHSVVGTGHPGIVYLEYPSYPIAFPMIALGAYLRHAK